MILKKNGNGKINMEKITKYQIISNRSASTVEDIIKKLIQEDWQPFGSLAYAFDSDENCLVYAQALVKYE